ncbi:unnamed protein product [Soboliphyme baturini]|uniref:RHD domain-containing protein n=1 Tax=Soboliphyme baturini TaxID=241478 RepID=A0A183JB47_9BILA|nr:unnamed protein product [Soboliphyme baturini]
MGQRERKPRLKNYTSNGEEVTYEVIMHAMPHPQFITPGTKDFKVKCMYRLEDETLKQRIRADSIQPIIINKNLKLPRCSYVIRKNGLNGPLLDSAVVGDRVYHIWECKGERQFIGLFNISMRT